MSLFLKVSTAVTLAIGPFVDSTDGAVAETALTLTQADFRLSKNGGAFAQKNETTSGSHLENGYYTAILNTTDTNTLGILTLAVNETGALPVWVDCMVVPANVWDSLFGADQLQVHVNEMTAGIITAAVIATDAIDADAIADNAINAASIAADAITAAKIADGAIDAATFAAGAITAAAIATNAIDDDALAADAVTAIQSGLAMAAALDIVDDFLDTEITAILAAVDTEVAAIKAKTDNLPTDPADASDIATATTAIAGYIDTEVASILAAVDTEVAAIKAKTDNLPAAPAATSDIPTAATIADAVWDEPLTQPAGVFAWAGSFRNLLNWLGALSRNKSLQTSNLSTLRNDADDADLATSAISDDETTLIRGEWT